MTKVVRFGQEMSNGSWSAEIGVRHGDFEVVDIDLILDRRNRAV
jgi:hypothetical protein